MSAKCPQCGSAALSPDHPKWFECGTLGDRRGTFHHTTTCRYLSEFRKLLDARTKRLEREVALLRIHCNYADVMVVDAIMRGEEEVKS